MPAVSSDWPQTLIDHFILAKLEKQNTQPSRPAGKNALIRRATFDLTGLPPTAQELEAFQQDPSPDAFAKVVDRLLASPRYGERWGRHWLDVVRYADTAGETADYPVPDAWRYRNYVIHAFNADKPYDEFLKEQIAGDILARKGPPQRYAERVTATGYLAISRRFGFDSENYHHLTIQDTIDTLGQSVLGLTLGCARCHAHKFDPISMRDYYGLYGIFESTRYAFPGSEQKQKRRALAPLLPPNEAHRKWREFDTRLASLARVLEQQKKGIPDAVLRSINDLDGDFEMQAPAAGGSKGVLVPPWVYEGPIAVTTEAQSPFKNLFPLGKVGASIAAGTNRYRIAQALHLDPAPKIYVNFDFRSGTNDPAWSGGHRFWIGASVTELLIKSNNLYFSGCDHPIRKIEPNQWQNVQLEIDREKRTIQGKAGAPGDVVTFAGPLEKAGEPIDFLAFESSDSAPRNSIAIDNISVETSPISGVATNFPGCSDLALDAEKAGQELRTLIANGPFPLAYAVSEGTPQNSRIQLRGEPDKPGDEVPRGFPEVLGGGALHTGGSGRLELAQWLTRPDNPLTARVMVNRIWEYHFGQGLVKTPNDFGTRGQRPTHPDLLDFLASQFVKSGWSIKAMHRLILLSATYQQAALDSGVESEQPYSYFPRRRLDAEEIRDSILFVTGDLDSTMGEGHTFPNPTGWGFTQHGPFSAVYEHNRRSIYLMNQRIKRHPFLALFDGADPNTSTAERRTTTVPTQALFFLNDPFVHAKSERLSGKSIEECYRAVLGRNPDAAERDDAREFLAEYRAQLTAAGKSEKLAMAALARVLMGSNEFLNCD